jgi:antitoxin VapB
MPLYIRDDSVGELAREVQAATGARTVTEAVRVALERERVRLRDEVAPSRRLGKALALADAIGRRGPTSA